MLLSLVLFSRAQNYPQVDGPTSMSMSLPAEMSGRGRIDLKITLHYPKGGTHHLSDYAFSFVVLDEKGDQVKYFVLRSNQAEELELEGTDPVCSPRIEFNNQTPLTKGGRYQLLVFAQGPGILPMGNVKPFKLSN